MEPITIRWETGYMTINPDAFFPNKHSQDPEAPPGGRPGL